MSAHSVLSIVATGLALFSAAAAAQVADTAYPVRPIRFIIPFPPGGSADPLVRVFGNWFADKFGVPVVADNRPGAGTVGHLSIELLNALTRTEFVHVPYKGAGPAAIDVIGGRVQALIGSVAGTQALVASGKIRAIATGHRERLRSWPELPAMAETLPGFTNNGWYGIVVPAGTPAPIINKLSAEMKRALANAEFSKHIETIGMEPAAGSTPRELSEFVRSEIVRWTKVVRDAGIRLPGV
jgi:tripartite-type tricarboxylate transporter receptor subunit TctC